jgi:hypothetical protein
MTTVRGIKGFATPIIQTALTKPALPLSEKCGAWVPSRRAGRISPYTHPHSKNVEIGNCLFLET